jgi:hypothetical protein
MSVIIKLLSKFDDSGLKKAKSGFGGLGKALGAVGIGFGIKAIADTLLDAAKAAAADAKSTKLLNTQLERNAGATAASLKENDRFIESLSLQTGIMDDDLRPTMARFGNVTKNVKEAQKLLKITIDATAGSGKSQTKIANAVAKAYGGNTTALKGMFPELLKSKDVLGDFAKTYEGMAEANADPFMKLNNSMDILKEKLGVVVLPILIDFIDEISKPGGAIEVVGKFFDDLANPKSDAGKTFEDIKKAVGEVITGVKDFFALFGNGDAIEGFKNIATSLIQALPALLALKGIMMLASAGKAIANLVQAVSLMTGANAVDGIVPVGDGRNKKKTPKSKGNPLGLPFWNPLTAGVVMTLSLGGDSMKGDGRDLSNTDPKTGMRKGGYPIPFYQMGKPATTNNVTINVQGADPKATVDALGKYIKQNGSLPYNFYTKKVGG